MSQPVVFMFSGQGSQYYQMGRGLYRKDPVFRGWMQKLDSLNAEAIGASVLEELYDAGKRKCDPFDDLSLSSQAIIMVQYALARTLIEKVIEPDFVLGASMGEIVSALVAEVLPYEEAAQMIPPLIRALQTHCPEGRMIAVLDDPRVYRENALLRENTELAAVNLDCHFVLSCHSDRFARVEGFLRAGDITYEVLPVAFGFHSSLMNSAESACKEVVRGRLARPPAVPLVSCCYADFVERFHDDYLWDVLRRPIWFQKTIRLMEEKGEYVYLDLGPTGTLATLGRHLIGETSRSESLALLSPFDRDLQNLEKVGRFFRSRKAPKAGSKGEKMIAYVFPGQGSQRKGMGGSLFEEFRELTDKASTVLGYSIRELCLDDPDGHLSDTRYAQPALYTVNALHYFKVTEETARHADYLAGHSLGEYNALLAAGAFDFETGLRLVQKRGELMGRAAGGGMAAVIGLAEETIRAILEEHAFHDLTIANYNSPSQLVISGPRADIDRAGLVFESAGARLYVPLRVSGAFHSPWMNDAGAEFAAFLTGFQYSPLTVPVISNVHARPYGPSELIENLVQQITRPVRWTESIRYLLARGKMEFEEIGPDRVLTGLIRAIRRESKDLPAGQASEAAFEAVAEQSKGQAEARWGADPTDRAGGCVEAASQADPEGGRPEGTAAEPGAAPRPEKAQGPGAAAAHDARDRAAGRSPGITAESLGSAEYREEYGLKYAYAAGAMYKGIASKDLVVRMGKAGMIGYLSTGGLGIEQVEESIQSTQRELSGGEAYGVNLLNGPAEEGVVDLLLKYEVRNAEAAAYIQITPALVRWRLKGLRRSEDGGVSIHNRIMAKVSRPEVAAAFLSPAPGRIINRLVEEGKVTAEEAELATRVPMADDLCVEADSGGHTDQGVAYVLMPAMIRLRDEKMREGGYAKRVRVGAAGGIGTPEAAAAAFVLGADFILTGSINQCTVEAGTSDAVKDMLQEMNVQDTAYAPAGDMFEIGAKVQVLRKGVFFPARANRLYALYQQHNALGEIDEDTRKQIQERYFQKSFEEVYEDANAYYPPEEIERAERNPKHKMALVFRWYFGYSTDLALRGDQQRRVDYQVQCGPALGAFNQWVKGTELESWRNRHVDQIAQKIMHETAELLERRFSRLSEG